MRQGFSMKKTAKCKEIGICVFDSITMRVDLHISENEFYEIRYHSDFIIYSIFRKENSSFIYKSFIITDYYNNVKNFEMF